MKSLAYSNHASLSEFNKRAVDFDVLYDFSSLGKDGPLFKEGYLKKQGNSHKTWKKRWFECSATAIRYYKTKKDYIPISTIEMKEIQEVTAERLDKKSRFNIQLHTSARTWQILAETEEEQEQWLEAFKRNHDCFHQGTQHKCLQKVWLSECNSVTKSKGNANIVELYGKHLSHSRSFPVDHTLATDIFSWYIEDIDFKREGHNERLMIRSVMDDEITAIELGSLDTMGQGASSFLKELADGIKHNKGISGPGDGAKQLKMEHWPIRFKRGFLSVSVGKHEMKTMWVQIGGLILSYYDKPESPKAVGQVLLDTVQVHLEHFHEEKYPDHIVLKPANNEEEEEEEESNRKTWVTLSGSNISSLKPSSELQRLEWVQALCLNKVRLRKEPKFVFNPAVARFKRDNMKFHGLKVWVELDEMTLRIYAGSKSTRAKKLIPLQKVSAVVADDNKLALHMAGSLVDYELFLESFAIDWKQAIDNNRTLLQQIFDEQVPTSGARPPTFVASPASPETADRKLSHQDTATGSIVAKGGASSSEKTRTATSVQELADESKHSKHFRRGPSEIEPSEIQITGKLGDGCFGEVYKGFCRSNEVAVKVPLVQNLDETQLQLLRKEVEIMSANPHPNIVLFMGACTVPGEFKIVTELMDGDLDSLLKKRNRKQGDYEYSLYERMKMAKDAALGMNWLHRSNPPIVHRDLKSANLLYNKTNGRVSKVKVCDFGLSTIKQMQTLKDTGGAKGTPLYMPPEVMLQEEFDEKADVYSYGIVLWELLTGLDPFPHHTEYQSFVRAIVENEERPSLPTNCPPTLRSLIESCWHPQPDYRPDFDEINNVLDEIIVEAALAHEEASEFWINAFLRQHNVPWRKFIQAFYTFIGEQLPTAFHNEENAHCHSKHSGSHEQRDLTYRCIHSLLVEESTNDVSTQMVNIETFANVVQWFGPQLRSSELGQRSPFLENVEHILSQEWFHGRISNIEAKQRLMNETPGSFLVRFSASKDCPGAFALAHFLGDGKVNNLRITRDLESTPPAFQVDAEHRFSSLCEAIDALQTPLGLQKACPGSYYFAIFAGVSAGGVPTYGVMPKGLLYQ
ncbi:copper transport protein ctr1 [Balamuthia mandrillaris]